MTANLPEPIGPTAHGIADYGLSSALAVGPVLLDLDEKARRLGLLFAALQTSVNTLTDTPVGLKPLMSLRTHGWIELATGPVFVALPILTGAVKTPKARNAWLAVLGALAVTYLLTDWKPGQDE